MVLKALISGETPSRTIEYIFSGSVVAPMPVTKKVMTKSLNERVNARRDPAIMPGRICGTVILKKVNTLGGKLLRPATFSIGNHERPVVGRNTIDWPKMAPFSEKLNCLRN